MIEKLKETQVESQRYKIVRKVNDLVDVVNALIKENNIHEKQIDKLQMKTDTIQDFVDVHSYTIGKLKQKERMIGATTYDKLDGVMNPEIDKCAKYRKWNGKLCRFWNTNKEYAIYGILEEVKADWVYKFRVKGEQYLFFHCEPVKPDESIIYKGE